MSDSFDVSARVWPIVVDGVEVYRVVALNGLVFAYHDADTSIALVGKEGIADFIWKALEACPNEAVDVLKAVTEAVGFAFSSPPPVKSEAKREAKSKDELRDWLQAKLVHSKGSVVKAVDVRWAWHEHFKATHKTGYYWTPHKFHDKLRELGYTLARVSSDNTGTGTHIMDVFMRDVQVTSVRPTKRKGVNLKYPPLPNLQS